MSLLAVEVGISGGIVPPLDPLFKVARRNEEKGFHALWWPDHLMGWHPQSIWTPDITPIAERQSNPHIYLEPFTMMAAAAMITERVRLGVVVTDVIRRHPAVLAQTALTLDHISKGRAILGLGSGEVLNVEPYGMDFSQPVGKLEEGLQIIRLLMAAEGPVDFQGKYWHLDSAVLGLQPYGSTPPPIWLAAHGPRMLKLTGRYCDGWIPTKMSVEEYRDKLALIRSSAREAGRDPGAITPGMLAYVLIDEDPQVADRFLDSFLVKGLCLLLPAEVFKRFGAEPPFGEGSSGFHGYIPAKWGRAESEALFRRVPREVVGYYCFHGTPEQVAEQVMAYAREGLQHIVLWNLTPFADASKAGSSFRCLERVKEILARA